MITLTRSGATWWQKPLAEKDGKLLPAELAVLNQVLEPGEEGAWLNSRSTESGVVDLEADSEGALRTVRLLLPDFVQEHLSFFYEHQDVSKGVFDLVIWRESDRRGRFVEVKCPHWDKVTPEQARFAEIAHDQGIRADIVEWEFGDHHSNVR